MLLHLPPPVILSVSATIIGICWWSEENNHHRCYPRYYHYFFHQSVSMICLISFYFSLITSSTEFDHEQELFENNVESVIQENNHNLLHTLNLDNIPNTRLRSTSTIEKFSKKNLPFREFVSVVANATNALLGVSIFAMPWGFAKSGLIGNLIYCFQMKILRNLYSSYCYFLTKCLSLCLCVSLSIYLSLSVNVSVYSNTVRWLLNYYFCSLYLL